MGLSDILTLALGCEFKEYKPFQPVCKISDPADKVFLVLSGKLYVLFNRILKIDYLEVESGLIPVINPGNSLGDIGVLYGNSRYP